MNKEKKIKLAITIAIGIIVIIGIIKIVDIYYEKNNTEKISMSNFIENETEDEKGNTKIKVYITGEVKNQGVIELEEGDRIADAIEKAGGQTEQASLKNVNLAYQLEDGQKIYIPNVNDNETEIVDDGASGVVDDTTNQTVVNINIVNKNVNRALNNITFVNKYVIISVLINFVPIFLFILFIIVNKIEIMKNIQ